jgi:hypothetical protein
MISTVGGVQLGIATTSAVSGRGFTPEELAEHAINEVISIGNNSHPVLQAQAEAFRDDIRGVMLNYLRGGDQTVSSGDFQIQFPTASAAAAIIRIA